jgi:type I site-specific restriction endonuclease
LILKYPTEICTQVKGYDYQKEIDFIVTNPIRNNYVANLALSLEGNTLILFQFVEKHGRILHSIVESKAKDGRKIFFIAGETDVEVRDSVRHITEKENNAIIVASYGTFSTGVSIRNLHNIIFASPSKSKIRNLQSIGRGLRLGENKEKAFLYDIVDDLRYNNEELNFAMKHYVERMKIYHEEKFKISTYKIGLDYVKKES